jgi:hypothetical protein
LEIRLEGKRQFLPILHPFLGSSKSLKTAKSLVCLVNPFPLYFCCFWGFSFRFGLNQKNMKSSKKPHSSQTPFGSKRIIKPEIKANRISQKKLI